MPVAKNLSLPFILIGIFHALGTFLLAGALYFILYPSFYGFAYPNSTSLNLFWLLFVTPLIFEWFFMQQALWSGNEAGLSLFKQRISFEILIKGAYIGSILLLVPDISLTQIRIFFAFGFSIILDALKLYLVITFAKRRTS